MLAQCNSVPAVAQLQVPAILRRKGQKKQLQDYTESSSLFGALHAVHRRQRVGCHQLQRGHKVNRIFLPCVLRLLLRLLLLLLQRRRLLCRLLRIGGKCAGLVARWPGHRTRRACRSCSLTSSADACNREVAASSTHIAR